MGPTPHGGGGEEEEGPGPSRVSSGPRSNIKRPSQQVSGKGAAWRKRTVSLPWGAETHISSPASHTSGGVAFKALLGGELAFKLNPLGARDPKGTTPRARGQRHPPKWPPNPSEHLVDRVGVRARWALRGGVGGRGGAAALDLAPGGRLLRAWRRRRRRVGQQKSGRGGALGGDALHDAGQAVEARHRSTLPGPGFCAGRGRLVCRGGAADKSPTSGLSALGQTGN